MTVHLLFRFFGGLNGVPVSCDTPRARPDQSHSYAARPDESWEQRGRPDEAGSYPSRPDEGADLRTKPDESHSHPLRTPVCEQENVLVS